MRLDVSVKRAEEIPNLLSLLREMKVNTVDIAHIAKDVDPVEVARQLKAEVPGVDITVYLSAKYFSDGASMDGAKMAFRKKFEEAKKAGLKKFLFISGHPRSPFDSLEMLHVVNDLRLGSGTEICCAFNPYFDPGRLREELERLRLKLGFPFVKGIAMQVGMDTGKLQKGVEQIRSISSDALIFGIVPAPCQSVLDHLRENAMYGVFLPNSYLLNVEMATDMTSNLLASFRELEVEPIVYSYDMNDLKGAVGLFRSN